MRYNWPEMRVLAGPGSEPRTAPWDSYWRSFERELRALGRSPQTITTYRRCAADFLAWLKAENMPADPTRVSRDDVLGYLAHLREDLQRQPATVRLRFATLQRFFAWLEAEAEIERTPFVRLKSPSVDQAPPALLSDAEIMAMLGACRGREFADRRDAAIIRVLVDTGARRAELLGMARDGLDLEDRSAPVLGKGNRPGVIYFGVKAARDLDRYLRVRDRHPKADERALWLGAKGPLGDDGLAAMLRRRARQAGIDIEHVHPHAFRHAFADRLKRGGASDEDTMTLGRWRDPRVMRRYGRAAAQERAREAHRRLSPGDRL